MSTASRGSNVTTASAGTGAALGGVGAGLAAAALMTNPAGWAIAGAALIGAGLGMDLGGALGSAFGGKSAKKKQKRALEAAQAIQQERSRNAEQENYLQQIRNARISRAGSLASSVAANISTSSLATAALSSIGSQSQHNIQYTANDQRLYQLYAMYMAEAGHYADAYQSIQATGQSMGNLGKSVSNVGMSIFSANLGSTPGLETGDIAQYDTFNGGNMPSGILGI